MSQNALFFIPSQCVDDEPRATKFRKQRFSRHLLKSYMILLKKNFLIPVNVILKALFYFSAPPRIFLKELEKCTENPKRLARCFLERVSLCS